MLFVALKMNLSYAPSRSYSNGLTIRNGGILKSMFLRTLLLVVFASLSAAIFADPLDDALIAYGKGDFETAARLVRPLAYQGNMFAQSYLAELYDNGQGVPQDYAEAAKWYRKAADQGVTSAQYNLAIMYANGKGVPQDYSETVKWYRKAAEQGLTLAQYNLGLMYDNGQGVPQNYTEAAKWYRKAAEQSYANAQNNLGYMYETGSGVIKNFVLAHMWYNLSSAAQETEEDKRRARTNRDRIEKIMTPQQVAQAQALADEWQSKSHVPNVTSGDGRRGFHPIEIVSTGTGFFVSQQGHLLTNHHVIEGCSSIRLRLPGQSSRDATLVARDSNNDLALLKSESRPDAVASLSSRKRPQLGQFAIIFGFPLTGVLSSSGNLVTGTVSALSGLQDDSRLFQISAPVQPGNSGGPVMDASGAVIGVVVGKLDARAVEKAIADIPQNVNFAIKGALAAGFLDSNGVDYVTEAGNQTIPVEEIAKRAIRFTVLVECLK